MPMIVFEGEAAEFCGPPMCLRCNRRVEVVEVETPHCIVYDLDPFSLAPVARYAPTGERIVTFACHGERFKWSNMRGVL